MLDRRQVIQTAGMTMLVVPSIVGAAGESSGDTSAFGLTDPMFEPPAVAAA